MGNGHITSFPNISTNDRGLIDPHQCLQAMKAYRSNGHSVPHEIGPIIAREALA